MDTSQPFVAVTLEAMAKYGLEAATLLAYITQNINYHERHSKQAWYHSERALAEKLGLGRNRVRRALDRLIAAGELAVEKGVGPNRTDGWRVVHQQPPVVSCSPPVVSCSPPTKKETNNKKKSMHREMPACSSFEKECPELLGAIRPLEESGHNTLSLARDAKQRGVTAEELQQLVAEVLKKSPKNRGGLLRRMLQAGDHERLRAEKTARHEEDVRRRIRVNAEMTLAELQRRRASPSVISYGLDLKNGLWRTGADWIDLKTGSEGVLNQLNKIYPTQRI